MFIIIIIIYSLSQHQTIMYTTMQYSGAGQQGPRKDTVALFLLSLCEYAVVSRHVRLSCYTAVYGCVVMQDIHHSRSRQCRNWAILLHLQVHILHSIYQISQQT